MAGSRAICRVEHLPIRTGTVLKSRMTHGITGFCSAAETAPPIAGVEGGPGTGKRRGIKGKGG